MIRMLQSPWMTAVLGSVVFVLTLFLSFRQLPKPQADKAGEEVHAQGAFALVDNPDLPLLLRDLQERDKELTQREQALREFERRVKADAAELEKTKQEVEQLKAEINQMFPQIKDAEVANLKKQAKTYAAMAPETAASILRHFDDTDIVRVLSTMKEEEAARILESISRLGDGEAKRVAQISRKILTTLTPASGNKS